MYNEKVKKKKKRGKEMNTGKENAKSIGTVRERERESYTLVKGRVALAGSLTHLMFTK